MACCKPSPKFVLAGLLVVTAGRTCFGEDTAQLRLRLVTAHQAAVASIRTLHCKATFDVDPANSQSAMTGEFWSAGGVRRIHQFVQSANLRNDFLVKDSEVKYTFQGMGVRDRGDRSPSVFDIWGFFLFSGPGGSQVPLDAYLDYTRNDQSIKSVTVDGQKLIQVKVTIPKGESFEGGRCVTYFDPRVNYLRCKSTCEYEQQNQPCRIEWEVTGFAEPAEGVFVPEGGVYRQYRKNKLHQTQTLRITNIELNKPIPQSVFQFRFPDRSVVRDNLAKKIYRVNSEGQIIEQIEDLAPNAAAAKLPISAPPPSRFFQQSESEPTSWLTWVSYGALIVLALCAVTFLIRLRRGGPE